MMLVSRVRNPWVPGCAVDRGFVFLYIHMTDPFHLFRTLYQTKLSSFSKLNASTTENSVKPVCRRRSQSVLSRQTLTTSDP